MRASGSAFHTPRTVPPAVAVTIYDIADEARVSIATVSRVFNEHPRVSEDTRRRVFRVAERLGYEPHRGAQSLARKDTRLISAVVPVMTSFFFMEVLRGLQDRIDGSAYDLLVYPSRTFSGVDGQLGRAVQRGRADGLLLVSVPLTPERARRVAASSQPVVLVDGYHPDCDSVSVDSRYGARVAVEHLLGRGHTRVGLLLPVEGPGPGADREAGYHDAHRAAGLDADPALTVVADWQHDLGGYTRFAGYRALQTLLDRSPDGADRPTAVFAAADIMAFGALRAAREAGLRVPGDLDVVGFDDVDASAYVGLTTLRQPMVEMGRLAIEKLLRRLEAPDAPPSHTVFAPRLVVRETTGGEAAALRP